MLQTKECEAGNLGRIYNTNNFFHGRSVNKTIGDGETYLVKREKVTGINLKSCSQKSEDVYLNTMLADRFGDCAALTSPFCAN